MTGRKKNVKCIVPQCPADVLDLIHACLNKGANLLLPHLETRLGQLATLLQAKELNNGQELNLKLLLQSLDDPAVVAELLASPTKESPAKDEVEVKVFAVLKTLIVRTFRHFVSYNMASQLFEIVMSSL